MGPIHSRPSAPTTARVAAFGTALPAERLLQAIGADPDFADDVLGDLAEEYALRAARDGVGAARRWYAREALRSTPHLVRSAIQHGGPRARVRLAACAAAATLTLTLTVVAVLARNGPPARLVVGVGYGADGIVVNNVRPVQLPVRVFDAAGRLLDVKGIQYQWVAGAPVTVSPSGVVTCTQRADATVRASLGPIAAHVDVRCRPVRRIEASSWISLVAGEPGRRLPFKAVGIDGHPVTQLRGAVRVLDGSVATLAGATVLPRAAGETAVAVEVGDQGARIRALVHEPVRTFTGLRPDQRLVAMPVRLARGDTVTWTLPDGAFWLKYLPRRLEDAPPSISVDGRVVCMPGDGPRVYYLPPEEHGAYCVVDPGGARVTVAHGWVGAPVVEGWLALERVENR